jgi:hypothetical protein
MQAQFAFFASIAFSLIAWGMVAARYIWPELRIRQWAEALRPLLVLHSFRFIGLAFLVPGVVSPDLPSAFAHSAAYGDIIAAILALLALILLPSASGVVIDGSSISGVQPISSMLSTKPITPGSWRGSWVPPISFRLSSCLYC